MKRTSVDLQFPIFAIASREGVVAMRVDDTDCVLLFRSHELAEMQIENIESAQPQLGRLRALLVPDAGSLREGLVGLPPDVTCAVWDAKGGADAANRLSIGELLRQLDRMP